MLSLIILISIFLISSIEIYTLVYNFKLKTKEIDAFKKDPYDKKYNYDSYEVSNDINIKLKPGRIYIKDNYNIFINISDKLILMEKDTVYKIESDFIIEIINVNGENITYYYLNNI